MTTTETTEIEETEEVEETCEPYRPPFLRITGTYPHGDDNYTTLAVEINLDDEPDLGEVDATGEVRSWMTDFVTQVIRELRSAPPVAVVLGGQLRDMFAKMAGRDPDRPGTAGDETVPADPEGGA